MKRFFIPILALLLFCPLGYSADPPKTASKPVTVTSAKVKAIPQTLLDALAKVEEDRISIIASDTALGIASSAVATATKQKSIATAAMAVDQAAFLRLWAETYGPVPTPEPPIPDPQPTPPVPPEPPEPPVPVPPVPPAPVAQKVQVVVIEETEQSTSAFSAVRNSKEIRQWATSGGHAVFFIDIDAATAAGGTWKTWADRARNVSLPYIGIAPHSGGDPLKEGECPKDVAGFLKLVGTYGGVGNPCPTGVCPVKGAK